MKKIVIAVLVVIALLVGGALIAPNFIDWNKYKDPILNQLSRATGYQYTLTGPLDLALLPYPRVKLEGLRVTVLDSDQPLLSLDQASVAIALRPLFEGNIEVHSIQLTKPAFNAVINADGSPAWLTPTLKERMAAQESESGASAAAQAPSVMNNISLNEIKINSGTLSYVNKQSGQTIKLDRINMILRGESIYGPYDLEGDFAYLDQNVDLNLTSGRIDNLAESVSLKVDARWPDLGSALSYSGVVAVDENFEFQGETSISSENPGRFVSLFGQTLPAYLNKPVSIRGIASIGKQEIAYRNLAVSYGSFSGNGELTAKNFGEGQTPDINIQMQAQKEFDLASFMPPKDPAAQDGIARMPDTFVLPREFYMLFDGKFGSVTFNGVKYEDVAVSIRKHEEGAEGRLKLYAPGSTMIDVDGQLDFGARSVSPDQSVTLSSPILSLEGKMESKEPAKLYGVLSKRKTSEMANRVFASGITLETQASLTPEKIEMSDLSLNVQATPLKISIAYIYGNEDVRDLLKLDITNYALDLDKWMQIISGRSSDIAAVAGKEPVEFQTALANFSLPFDLELNASAQTIKFKNQSYDQLAIKGGLYGDRLKVDNFALKNIQGEGLQVAGTVQDLRNMKGIDLSVSGQTRQLKPTLQSFAVEGFNIPDNAGEADFSAELKGAPDLLAFKANINAMKAIIEANGKINDVFAKRQINDLTLRVRHPNYVDLVRLYNPSFSSGVGIKKNLDIFASVVRKDEIYGFEELKAVIGPTEITGSVDTNLNNKKPSIDAALQVGELPIGEFMGMQSGGGQGRIQSSSLRQPEDVRWSRNAIPTEWMHTADIDLTATASSISIGRWMFEEAGANLTLEDGLLTVNQLDGRLADGHVALTGSVQGATDPRNPLVIDANILMQSISLEEFVSSFSGSKLLRATGTINLDSKVKASGISPAALIFDLRGSGTAKGSDLLFEGFDLARLSRALAEPTSSFTENFTRLLDTTMSGGTTKFDTFDSAFTITEGIVTFDRLNLDGPAAAINGEGNVNLPLWAIDLTTVVSLKEPENAPQLRTVFKGPLDRPGHTFGQSAMQQYFQGQMEGLILNPVLEKIQDKTGFPLLRQKSPPATQQPQTGDGAQPAPDSQQEQEEAQPAPEQQQEQRKPTSEEAIFGVIEGILKQSQ